MREGETEKPCGKTLHRENTLVAHKNNLKINLGLSEHASISQIFLLKSSMSDILTCDTGKFVLSV